MRISLLTIFLFLGFGMMDHAGNDETDHPSDNHNYPVPQHTEKLLFYVQRTHNRNTVIYELNLQPDGKLNKKDPVHLLWIRYEEGGVRKELTFIQTRVYGLDIHPIGKDNYLLHFRSYKKRDIFLVQTGKNKTYKALININGKLAELTNLFICSVTNALGIPSIVKYIDITGIDIATGNVVTERVIP